MAEPLNTVVAVIAVVVMFVGVLGTILPVIPGPVLIFLAALVYAVLDGFQAVGLPTLIVLGVLAALAYGADLLAGSLGARMGGASGWSVLAGMVAGLVGLILFSLPGGILGAILGVLGAEMIRVRDWKRAFKAGGGWLAGWVLSTVARLAICLTMVATFVSQVLLGPS